MSAINADNADIVSAEVCLIQEYADYRSKGTTLLTVSPYFAWKRATDRLLALCFLVPGLPLMGALIVLIRLTSRGPGVYRQLRVGKDGRLFTMYKLRSMRLSAEADTGPVWTSGKRDPRITPLGHLLRSLHLDELPQLFNVLRGEMSLLGPRPERPEFVLILAERIPGYMNRLAVLPGITGLAQINLPPDTDLDSVRRKQILDLEYIRTTSPWLELRMLLCTLLRVIGFSGQRAMRLMRVERIVSLRPSDGSDPQTENTAVPAARPVTPDHVINQACRDTMTISLDDTQELDGSEAADILHACSDDLAAANAAGVGTETHPAHHGKKPRSVTHELRAPSRSDCDNPYQSVSVTIRVLWEEEER